MCSIFLNLLQVGVLHVNQRMEIGDFKGHKLERNLVLASILCVVGTASNSDERALRHGSCGNSKFKVQTPQTQMPQCAAHLISDDASNALLAFVYRLEAAIKSLSKVNMTNGVTPRRWVHCANPALSAIFTKYLGSSEATKTVEASMCCCCMERNSGGTPLNWRKRFCSCG